MEKSLLRFLFNSFVIYGTFHIPSQNIRNQKKNVLKYDIETQSEVIQGLKMSSDVIKVLKNAH